MSDIHALASGASGFLSSPAPDDSGAQTQDRFEWQAAMATADVLAMYLESLAPDGTLLADSDFQLVCEHHEDWALISSDKIEIVSAKHKETAFGAFTTVSSLLTEGGVLHLYERWVALGAKCRCRVATTAGIGAEVSNLSALGMQTIPPPGPGKLTKSKPSIDALCAAVEKAHGGGVPVADGASLIESVSRFLAILRIEHSLAHRQHLPHAAPGMYAAPIAAKLGSPLAASAIWKSVLEVVRERMRSAGPRTAGRLPTVLGHEIAHGDEARCLTLPELDLVIRISAANPRGYDPLPRLPRTNRMAIKMATGRCSDNSIERAELLRLDYRQFVNGRGSSPSNSTDVRQLRRLLLRVVDTATHEVETSGVPWGAALWRKVEGELLALQGRPEALGMDADLLLGGVSDLSNQCKVWFSDRFDIAERIDAIRRGDAQW
ncbi:hypothetical protein [Aeromicrobium sp. P5_D10]